VNLNMTEGRTPGELAESLEYRELGIARGTAGQQGSVGLDCLEREQRMSIVIRFYFYFSFLAAGCSSPSHANQNSLHP
jgi:hypothetical protein